MCLVAKGVTDVEDPMTAMSRQRLLRRMLQVHLRKLHRRHPLHSHRTSAKGPRIVARVTSADNLSHPRKLSRKSYRRHRSLRRKPLRRHPLRSRESSANGPRIVARVSSADNLSRPRPRSRRLCRRKLLRRHPLRSRKISADGPRIVAGVSSAGNPLHRRRLHRKSRLRYRRRNHCHHLRRSPSWPRLRSPLRRHRSQSKSNHVRQLLRLNHRRRNPNPCQRRCRLARMPRLSSANIGTRKKTATSRNATKKSASEKSRPFPRNGMGKKQGAVAHASAPCYFGAQRRQ